MQHIEAARLEEALDRVERVVHQPLLALPHWVPIHRPERCTERPRGNPWRTLRRAREHERLTLLTGKEG